jgi:5'-nucleotidase
LGKVHFDAAAKLAAVVASMVKTNALSREAFLNINLPNVPLGQIKGVEITHLGEKSYGDIIEEGHDGKRTYYWIVRARPAWEPTEGTDIWALINGKISITPLHVNLTSHSALPALEQLSSAIFQELGSPRLRKQKGE